MQYLCIYQTPPRHHILQLTVRMHIESPQLLEWTQLKTVSAWGLILGLPYPTQPIQYLYLAKVKNGMAILSHIFPPSLSLTPEDCYPHQCWITAQYKCSNAQMHQFTKMHKYSNAQMHKCVNSQMRKYSNAQMRKYSNEAIYICQIKITNKCTICCLCRLAPTGHLDGKHTIFGRVHSGMKVVQRLGLVQTDGSDRPRHQIKIVKAFPVAIPNWIEL